MIEPPADTPKIAHGMWAACLIWHFKQPEVRARFSAETGQHLSFSRTPIDQMIDDATGYQSDAIHAFGEWFNREIWGPWEAEEPQL